MVVEGPVTNVTNFGAFVDVGVHQDGLVHVSEISTRYLHDPAEAPREPRPKTEPKPEPRKPTLEEHLARLDQQFHRR